MLESGRKKVRNRTLEYKEGLLLSTYQTNGFALWFESDRGSRVATSRVFHHLNEETDEAEFEDSSESFFATQLSLPVNLFMILYLTSDHISTTLWHDSHSRALTASDNTPRNTFQIDPLQTLIPLFNLRNLINMLQTQRSCRCDIWSPRLS